MKFLAACSVAALLAVSACTGSGAVDQTAGGEFRFNVANASGHTIATADRKKVHDFTGTLLSGGNYDLTHDAGKVVVLNFWASWCGPCQVETPQFDVLYRKNRASGVDFVGIDTKDIKSAAQSFVSDNKITFPIVYDEPGEVALRLGNLPAQSLPFTVLVDKQQRVAAVYVGPQSAKDLQPVLDRLVGEPAR
jgi:thiol-disulfide isomerase/thioredoxin